MVARLGMPPGTPAVDQSIPHLPGLIVLVLLHAPAPLTGSRIPAQACAYDRAGRQSRIAKASSSCSRLILITRTSSISGRSVGVRKFPSEADVRGTFVVQHLRNPFWPVMRGRQWLAAKSESHGRFWAV